jgi:hypothetical protein
MADRVEKFRSFSVLSDRQRPYLGHYPFSLYDDGTLRAYDNSFLDFPNRRGVLSEYYREIFASRSRCDSQFVRFEAHLNLTNSPSNLSNALLRLGFEPDDFEELYPEVYVRNFTFAFDVPLDSPDRANLRRSFLLICDQACKTLDDVHDVSGFLEAEVIPSTNFYVLPKGFEQQVQTETDPFLASSLVRSYFSEFEGDPNGEPIGVSKKSDIHVKFVGRLSSSDREEGKISKRSQFARFLEEAGFYRIVSVSGNTIYTAQFIEGKIGEEIYLKLREFIFRSGLADTIVIEPCAFFWRKSIVSEGIRYYSKVSPIVKYRVLV